MIVIVLCCVLVIVLIIIALVRFKRYDHYFSESRCKAMDRPSYPIVATTTTTPPRIRHLQYIIDNMYDQWMRPDFMLLNIPYVSHRMKTPYRDEDIATLDLKGGWARVIRCKDVGPATKLIGGLRSEATKDISPDTMLLSVDDDQMYSPNLVSMHVHYRKKYPEHIIEFIFDGPLRKSYINLEGFEGVSYLRKHITQDWFDTVDSILDDVRCFRSDDLVFTFLRTRNNIPFIVIHAPFMMTEQHAYAKMTNPLHGSERKRDYSECYDKLLTMNTSRIPDHAIVDMDANTSTISTTIRSKNPLETLYHFGGVYMDGVIPKEPLSHLLGVYPNADVIVYEEMGVMRMIGAVPYSGFVKRLMGDDDKESKEVVKRLMKPTFEWFFEL